MIKLLRAEFQKVVTTRLWWGMLLGTLFLVGVAVAAQIGTNGLARSDAPSLSTGIEQRAIFGTSAGGDIFALVAGIIFITVEFRHFTTRPTFLGEPHRGRVIFAKIIVSGAVGFVYGLASIALTIAIAVPWFSAKGVTIDWSGNDLYVVLLAVLAVVTIYAIVGLGIGVLVRNQIAAVIGSLVYLFVFEPLVAGLSHLWTWLADVYEFLPGAAAQAVTQIDTRGNTLLVPWAGGLVLLGWGLLFALVGWLEAVNRDVP